MKKVVTSEPEPTRVAYHWGWYNKGFKASHEFGNWALKGCTGKFVHSTRYTGLTDELSRLAVDPNTKFVVISNLIRCSRAGPWQFTGKCAIHPCQPCRPLPCQEEAEVWPRCVCCWHERQSKVLDRFYLWQILIIFEVESKHTLRK
jgi:hypothetical protein